MHHEKDKYTMLPMIDMFNHKLTGANCFNNKVGPSVDMIAIRDIKRGEELNYAYNTDTQDKNFWFENYGFINPECNFTTVININLTNDCPLYNLKNSLLGDT